LFDYRAVFGCCGLFIFACAGYSTIEYIFPLRYGFIDRNRRKKYVTQVQFGPINGECLLPKPANDHGTRIIIIYNYYIQINNLRAQFTTNVFDIQTHSKHTKVYEVNILPVNDRNLLSDYVCEL